MAPRGFLGRLRGTNVGAGAHLDLKGSNRRVDLVAIIIIDLSLFPKSFSTGLELPPSISRRLRADSTELFSCHLGHAGIRNAKHEIVTTLPTI